jgi:glyoxylase-like metal-dependent hydrolase (beta-lactamase superfamily II)
MITKIIPNGILSANTYILIDEDTKETAIIDCGGEFEIIHDVLQKYGAKPKYILNTHAHFDHVMGEKDAQEALGIPVYIHENDKCLLENLPKQGLKYGFECSEPPKDIRTFDENAVFKLGAEEIKVIHTPGHTKGSVCFLCGNSLYSGDTLFYGSIGRTDLEGGNFEEIRDSITKKLFSLDENTDVYPGHDTKTTIGYEKKYNNPFGSQI